MKMLRATMPTKPAAIHSMVSMKRSIHARFMSAPNGCRWEKGGTAAGDPCRRRMFTRLLCERVVLGERGLEFGERRIRVAAVLLDALAPGLDQRLGRFLPKSDLLGRQRVDLVAGLRLDLIDPGVLHLAPEFADLAGGLGVAVV